MVLISVFAYRSISVIATLIYFSVIYNTVYGETTGDMCLNDVTFATVVDKI